MDSFFLSPKALISKEKNLPARTPVPGLVLHMTTSSECF